MKPLNNRAFWKYYWDINLFNIMISLFFGIYFGIIWSLLIFCSYGIFIGFLAFRYMKNEEYYFYYNLGLTKAKLIKSIFCYNLIASIPLFLILIAIK
jgi:hypothetical protein